MNWYLHEVHDEEIDPELVLLGCEKWFQLSGYGHCQTMRFWSAEDPSFSNGISLHDITIVMRLAVNTPGAPGPILSWQQVYTVSYTFYDIIS